uniref:hypothetical protein n=1 Tax=Pseudonocardia acaciae TaxID=551276 RepID=UPI0004912989
EDPHWWQAEADGPQAHYRALDYLRRRSQPGPTQLPAGLAAADVWDELILSAWCWWDHKARERELLARAQRYGLSLSDLGAFLGIRSRQGMRDYLDRGAALLDERARHAATPARAATGDGATSALTRHRGRTRAERGADVHATRAARRAAAQAGPRRRWIAEHRPVITATLDRLLRECARAELHPNPSDDNGDDNGEVALGDYLSWLAEDLSTDAVTDGTFGALGLVLGELRAHPTATEAPANHGIHQAIRAADRLRADYANLTGLTTPAADVGAGR